MNLGYVIPAKRSATPCIQKYKYTFSLYVLELVVSSLAILHVLSIGKNLKQCCVNTFDTVEQYVHVISTGLSDQKDGNFFLYVFTT